MPSTETTVLVAIVLAVVVGIAVALTVAIGRWWDRWVRQGRARIGQRAERQAERLLKRAGYRILERQVQGTWELVIDGEVREVYCRADLLVTKGRERFIAEVKSGVMGSSATHPATRRQLLEYAVAFDVEGVLLVDMRNEEIQRVELPLR